MLLRFLIFSPIHLYQLTGLKLPALYPQLQHKFHEINVNINSNKYNRMRLGITDFRLISSFPASNKNIIYRWTHLGTHFYSLYIF